MQVRSIRWFPECIGCSEPFAFGHQVPVDLRENLFLHVEPFLGGRCLIGLERGGCLAAVLELAEHELAISSKDRAALLAIVLGLSVDFAELLKNVLH